MIGVLLDYLIIVIIMGICGGIAWTDISMRLEKRKKEIKEARKNFEESIDISQDE